MVYISPPLPLVRGDGTSPQSNSLLVLLATCRDDDVGEEGDNAAATLRRLDIRHTSIAPAKNRSSTSSMPPPTALLLKKARLVAFAVDEKSSSVVAPVVAASSSTSLKCSWRARFRDEALFRELSSMVFELFMLADSSSASPSAQEIELFLRVARLLIDPSCRSLLLLPPAAAAVVPIPCGVSSSSEDSYDSSVAKTALFNRSE